MQEGEKMTKSNGACLMALVFVLDGKLEDVREVKTNLNWKLSSKQDTVRGDRKIFVGKVAGFSHVLNWRIKLNYQVHRCQ